MHIPCFKEILFIDRGIGKSLEHDKIKGRVDASQCLSLSFLKAL